MLGRWGPDRKFGRRLFLATCDSVGAPCVRVAVMTLWQQRSRNDTSDNSEDTIASRFERQVAAVPDKLAIVTDEISLTYRALDLKASRIAAALASLPSQRDRPIMLFMKDEAARIAAMLGALKANRIFISACAQFAGEMGGASHRRLRSRADHRR